MTWYVRTDSREFGPLSEQALRAIAATGQIDVKTLVRRSVSEEWVSVATVPGILPPSAPPAPPAPPPALTLEGLPIPVEVDTATPWRRFWARWVDVVFEAALLGFTLGTIRPSLFQPGGWGAAHSQLFGWFLTPVVMVLDAVIYAVFGNTVGKAIAGIAVRDDSSGGRLPFFVYLKRNFELYFVGLGTAFPLVALFTLYFSFRTAERDDLSSWDLSAGSRVFARSMNPVRTWVIAVVYIAMLATLTQLRMVEERRFQERQSSRAGSGKFAEKQLQDAADSVNRSTPRMIDPQTRLDRAELAAGLVFTYEYTLVNQSSRGVASESQERFQRQVRQRLHVMACDDHKLDALLRLASSVKYIYRDKDGGILVTAVVSSADCLR